jgi:hypothetical protein
MRKEKHRSSFTVWRKCSSNRADRLEAVLSSKSGQPTDTTFRLVGCGKIIYIIKLWHGIGRNRCLQSCNKRQVDPRAGQANGRLVCSK